MHDKAAAIRFIRKHGAGGDTIITFSSPTLPPSAKMTLTELNVSVDGKLKPDRILALAESPY